MEPGGSATPDRYPFWVVTSRLRLAVLLAALAVAAACGQKPGVSGSASPLTPTSGSSEATSLAPGGAPVAEDSRLDTPRVTAPSAARTTGPAPGPTATRRAGDGQASGPASPARASASGDATVRPSARPPAPAGGASPPEPRPPSRPSDPASPEDRTGVSDTEITIGLHAPITGAAPVPQDSLEKAKGLYWRYLAEQGGVFGRNVRVVIKDDQFNPSRAVQVCRELVEQHQVFLLMGIGTDQTIACARYAAQAGVPYLATGGSEAGFRQLTTYFNVSMTFPQQAPMTAQIVKRRGLSRVGILTNNTPNYADTHQALEAAARAAGLDVVRSARINKNATQSETLAEAGAMRSAGAEAVMLMVAPLVFVNLAHSAQSQAYNPLWTGPGLTSGLNLVAEFGCPSIGRATFLSPFPQLDVIDRFDPDYRRMYRKVNGEEPDDIGLGLWGLDKTLHRFFEATGRELSRPRFLATLRSGREFASNVLPPVRYAPGDPFGASQAHVLEADCANRRYKTLHTFVSSLD